MTVRAWRIVKSKRAATAFLGEAAKRTGGRWNSPGTPMVYVAGSTSLAMLEMLVHLQARELLTRYALFEISFDEALIKPIDRKGLPRNWRKSPSPSVLQEVGDEWVARLESAVLKVPSAVVPTEWNYLLNPLHPEFGRIAIGPKKAVRFDSRLVRTTGR